MIFPIGRYCPDPPSPPTDGGTSDWDSTISGVTLYNTIVTYGCEKARSLAFIESDGSITHHDTQAFKCEWNQTWTSYAEVSIKTIFLLGPANLCSCSLRNVCGQAAPFLHTTQAAATHSPAKATGRSPK